MKNTRKYIIVLLTIFCLCILTGCEKEEIPFPETTLTEEDLENKLYYNQLETEEARLSYKELYEGIKTCSEEIYIHSNSEVSIGTLLYTLLEDYPEMFWCDVETEVSYQLVKDREENYVILYPEYLYSKEEVSNKQQEIEQMTKDCISACKEKESDYEKVKYIYEYIIDSVEYDEDAPNDQNIYSALVAKRSVCAGYAKAVQYLLENAGVECATMTGEAFDENGRRQGHAWNLVKCDDKYYYVDATWGDAEKEDDETLYLRNYDYLCCSETELSKTHMNYDENLPKGTSEDLNYYRMNDMFYETFDSDAILGAMEESIAEKEEYTTLKFGSKEDYEAALEALESTLLDEALQYQMRYYNMSQSGCNYDYHEVLWKINIYWSYE